MPNADGLEIDYWELNPSSSPVLDFISEVKPEAARARIQKTIEYLGDQGMHLLTNPKIFKKIAKNLYELRVNWGSIAYRILVVVKEKIAYLVHAFRKKTNKISQRHIKLAIQRRNIIYAYVRAY